MAIVTDSEVLKSIQFIDTLYDQSSKFRQKTKSQFPKYTAIEPLNRSI